MTPRKMATHNALQTPDSENILYFRPFMLYPEQYISVKEGEVIPLGSRAL